MNSFKPTALLVLLCSMLIIVPIATKSQDIRQSQTVFPTIASTQFIEYHPAGEFRISNNAQYFSTRTPSLGSFIWQRSSGKPVFSFAGSPGFASIGGWSVNIPRFAEIDSGENCNYPQAEANLSILEPTNKTTSKICLPFNIENIGGLTWSPFSDDMLLIQEEWLFDLKTKRLLNISI